MPHTYVVYDRYRFGKTSTDLVNVMYRSNHFHKAECLPILSLFNKASVCVCTDSSLVNATNRCGIREVQM